MEQTGMTHSNAWHRMAFFVLAAVTLPIGFVGAAAGAASNAPRIVGCRIGFDGKYKVGFWTPMWVAVAGDVAKKAFTVEVMTRDSDGVATTVSTSLPTSGGST